MPVGIVQFFLEKKGYGYIRVPESREEFYVRRKHIQEPMQDGDWVEFEIREDKNGLFATNVRKVKQPEEL